MGLTTYFDNHGSPDMQKLAIDLLQGQTPKAPYTLDDMAQDSISLLLALRIKKAHVCGTSLGTMITKAMAID